MLRVTKLTDYATLILTVLAARPETVLSAPELAERVESAVGRVLDRGLRTVDIMAPGMTPVGAQAMGDAVAAALED